MRRSCIVALASLTALVRATLIGTGTSDDQLPPRRLHQRQVDANNDAIVDETLDNLVTVDVDAIGLDTSIGVDGSTSTLICSPVTALAIANLNTTVGGRLEFGFPIAQPCFSSFSGSYNSPTNDPAQCAAVQNGWRNDRFQVDSFGGYPTPNWATCQAKNQGCLLDYEDPANPAAFAPRRVCYQGSVPPLYIDVMSPSDIRAGISFSKKYCVPLIIKNTGHDYKGRSSSGIPSLGLWTHHLTSKSFSPSFVAQGCAASTAREAVTLGAGVLSIDALNYVETLDRTIVTGACRTVGLSGGWVAGGGHSAISNRYGLGVDNALQFKVVTADGTLRTVSRCSSPDLFFALAGGGGSTFGVITETTFAVYPKETTQVAFIAFRGPNRAAVDTFLGLVVDNALPWVIAGFGGYVNADPVPQRVNAIVFLNSNKTQAEVRTAMAPVMDFVATLGADVIVNDVFTVGSYYEAYNMFIDPPSATVEPRAATFGALKNALTAVYPPGPARPGYGAPAQLLFTTPFNKPATGGTSETPAWRTAVIHAIVTAATYWNSTTAERIAANQRVETATAFLRNVAPNSGAYQSEALVHEPNYKVSFWGATNANKLSAIKLKYDPNNVFTCWQCIEFAPLDPRYSCYL